MQETLPIIFAVVIIIITIILSVVGIQMIIVLAELRRTLKKVNTTLDEAENKFNQVLAPIQSLGGMASGLQTGFKVFETFVAWITKNKDKDQKK